MNNRSGKSTCTSSAPSGLLLWDPQDTSQDRSPCLKGENGDETGHPEGHGSSHLLHPDVKHPSAAR